MSEEEKNRQPTWKEWLILKKLATCKDSTPTYKKIWAERIGAFHLDPILSRVFKLLESLDIIEVKPWIASCKMIKINIKKLDKFIEHTSIYKEFKQYVYDKELFIVGV